MSRAEKLPEADAAKTLRLRGSPPPVARISRRALAATGAALAAGLAGAIGWSLAEHRKPAAVEPTVAAPTPSERVTALPKGYLGPAGVPALGPPLPGDLGRPILKAARDDAPSDPSPERAESLPRPLSSSPDPEVQARAVARRAAREANLFVATAGARGRDVPPSMPTPPSTSLGVAPEADARTTSAERLRSPASPYILQAGAVIPAALITGLRSDAPGLAIAQVTQDVHDSLGGGVLLIPAGARLIGEYEARALTGQSRLSVTWTRLILPSGRSIILDKLPGADSQGMAGLQDGVDRHGGRVLAAAGLSTVLAIGAEAGTSGEESDLVRAIRRGGSDAVGDLGRQIVGRSLDLAPTLTIRAGAPLRVLLTRDLVLEPYVERMP